MYCIFELSEAYTTRIDQKTVQKPSKKAKKAATGTNILPQKAKVQIFFPPPPNAVNVQYIQACPPEDFLSNEVPYLQVSILHLGTILAT